MSATDIRTGQIATIRLGPNQDLVEGLQQAAAELGFARAIVRSGLGSLIDATLENQHGEYHRIDGPAVEILTVVGELATQDGEEVAGVSGLVGDPHGRVWAGRFLPGRNPVCVTAELVIEEMVEIGRAA